MLCYEFEHIDSRKIRKLYVKHLNIIHMFKLIRFFLYINIMPKVRKYYRYMMCHKPHDIIKSLALLFLKLSPLYKLIFNSKLVVVALIDNRGNICGICHINVNIQRREGTYGIIIVPSLHGRGMGKLLSIYTILYTFKLFKEVYFIKLRVDVDNINAIKLYKRLGFIVYAYNSLCDKRNNTWIACYEMVLTRENFFKSIVNV